MRLAEGPAIPKTVWSALQRGSRIIGWAFFAAALFAAVALPTEHFAVTLREPGLISGYALFSLAVLLFAFGIRKKLPILPAAAASTWKLAHTTGGFLMVALFWLHVGELWPSGIYEQALALVFYSVSISGLLGLIYQKTYPPRLTQTGVEVIFERIPDEIAGLRDQAEATVLMCTRNSGSDTLARFYVETFQWFFRRPRFLFSHLWGAQRPAFWVAQRLDTVRRYLDEKELRYVDRLSNLAHAKARLDLHYAAQGLLKAWLLVHVPLAVALLSLALWHMLVVNIYAL